MDSLLEPEFLDPYTAWKEKPSPKASSLLLRSLDPVIESAMRTYGGAEPSPTLRSKAKLITLDALQRYDQTKAKLRTHLMVNLQGLRRAAAKERQIISIPERVAMDLGRLREAETELRDKYGRDPSDLELSDLMGISAKRLEHVRRANPGVAEGSIVQEGDGGTQVFNPAVANTNDKTWLSFVYHDLQPTDQVILEHTVGLNGKPVLSKQMIARKLGISPGAVSQRAAKIQARLDLRDQLDASFL